MSKKSKEFNAKELNILKIITLSNFAIPDNKKGNLKLSKEQS